MFRTPLVQTAWFAHAVLIAIFIASPVIAAESIKPLDPPDEHLVRFIVDAVNTHARTRAAIATVEAANARTRAADGYLYSPELEVEYETAGEITKTIGVSRTIDWSGKRRAQSESVRQSISAAKAGLLATRQEITQQLLVSLAQWKYRTNYADLLTRRVKLHQEFSKITGDRFAAGDINQTEHDVAVLALAEARMQATEGNIAKIETLEQLYLLTTIPVADLPVLPKTPPLLPNKLQQEEWLSLLPEIRIHQANLKQAQAEIRIAQQEQRPDPTLAFKAGKEGDETLAGITLSIPITAGKRYRAQTAAVMSEANRAHEEYRDAYRASQARLVAATEKYRLLFNAYSEWLAMGPETLSARADLLRRLWENGEISTTDFLVQVQQTLGSELAAIELEANVWQHWFGWLAASGQTDKWLGINWSSNGLAK